jgi:hypothetical protein
MDAPPDDGRFPYHLTLRRETGALIREGSVVEDGERLEVVLQADTKKLRSAPFPRYWYAFAVDGFGRSQLLWPPRGEGNFRNRLPGSEDEPEVLVNRVTVAAPFAVDTYLLVTTKDPLPDPAVLEGAGARTRGGPTSTRETQTPLGRLLAEVATGTRGMGIRQPTPLDWSIQRYSVRSAPRSGR